MGRKRKRGKRKRRKKKKRRKEEEYGKKERKEKGIQYDPNRTGRVGVKVRKEGYERTYKGRDRGRIERRGKKVEKRSEHC